MDLVPTSYMPGDPRLIDQIVYELKSQGIFDQFRKECIADVDTKPAYQNLRQRVEGSVTNFLNKQKFSGDMNKNQLREQLRKSISESGLLETGVERIVDQVVNPKINTIFLPKVEDIVYRFLGLERPNREYKKEVKVEATDLLPNDLEAVSPESVHDQSLDRKEEDMEINENSFNSSNTKTEEDESPPFEPLEENNSFCAQEENSVDSHLSGISGLIAHNDSQTNEMKDSTRMEISEDNSQNSQNSYESHLSLIVSEDSTKMEICEDITEDKEKKAEIKEQSAIEESRKDEKIASDEIIEEELIKPDKKSEDDAKKEDKKESKRNYDKYKSSKSDKERKNDKDRRSSSKSENKKEHKDHKSSSKYSSTKDKEKKESRNSKDEQDPKSKERDKSKDKSSKYKDNKDKIEKGDKDKDKEKEKYHKNKSEREKSKNSSNTSSIKPAKERSSSSSKKDSSSKDKNKVDDKKIKERDSSSKYKDSSSKDREPSKSSKERDKQRSNSSSSSKDRDKKDSKSKSSDKLKKNSDKKTSSSKKDKDKKSVDDHYSSKEKKSDRRSTDRDSNDGSSKANRNGSFTENFSQSYKSSSKDSSEMFSSGSGDSSNSDKIETNTSDSEQEVDNAEGVKIKAPQSIKYIKPKFASNIHEAMKLMKIRKQLAKLERQNQLALVQVQKIQAESEDNNDTDSFVDNLKQEEESERLENKETSIIENNEIKEPSGSKSPMPKSQELSMESFEALEAKLAEEMSNVNYNLYGEEDDCAEYTSITSPVKKRKSQDELKTNVKKIVLDCCEDDTTTNNDEQKEEIELVVNEPYHSDNEKYEARNGLQKGHIANETIKDSDTISENQQDSEETNELISVESDNCVVFTGFDKVDANNSSEAIIRNKAQEILKEIMKKDIGEKVEKNCPYKIDDFANTTGDSLKPSELNLPLDAKYIDTNSEKENRLELNQNNLSRMSIRDVKIVCTSMQDMVQKNGKKHLVKVDAVDHNLAPKLSAVECKKLLKNKEVYSAEQHKHFLEESNVNNIEKESNDNLLDQNFAFHPRSGKNSLLESEDENKPCYYFEQHDKYEKHLEILKGEIKKLENSIEKQSLLIKNNVRVTKKRGRKRKTQDVQNNVSLTKDINLEAKKKHANSNKSIQNNESLDNPGFTLILDISHNQSFNLPLSPADSDKSGEHKKEEPVTVKIKRTGRGSASKRYESDDLYKPRPVFNYTTSRRRGGKTE